MTRRFGNTIVYLAVLAVFSTFSNAAICSPEDTECEFWLEVGFKLTMMDGNAGVEAKSGELYYIDNGTRVTNSENIISADGFNVTKLVIVANGKLPGPPIEVYENQIVKVHVKNNLPSEATSIHWHGLHQRGTSWMDGVAFVNQCPIESGQTFTYKFKASPTGTFMYHSHIGLQRTMGLYGPFIIHEKNKNLEFQHTLIINDWNHDSDSNENYYKMLFGLYINGKRRQQTQSLDGANYTMFNYQSGLINGKGRIENPDGSNNGAPLHVFNVIGDKTYRFRLINAGKVFPFRISFDGHTIILIASDGYPIDNEPGESIIINPGERYDVQILTANAERTNYWIRAETLEEQVNHIARAILRYDGADDKEPVTQPLVCNVSNPCKVINCPFKYYPKKEYRICTLLDELKAPKGDPAPTSDGQDVEEKFLNFAFPGTPGNTPGSVNGRSMELPPVSALTQPKELADYTCDKKDCGEQKICTCMHSLTLDHNKIYQLIFLNMGNGKGFSHPVHMHGHAFHVVKMGYGRYDNMTGKLLGDNLDIDCGGGFNVSRSESFCNNAKWRNKSWYGDNVPGLELNIPPRKDTVIVPTGGYVVVRIKADNPGVWYMHCHIELHNMNGMAMVLNESFPEQWLNEAPVGFPKCGNFNFSEAIKGTTMSLYINISALLLCILLQI